MAAHGGSGRMSGMQVFKAALVVSVFCHL
jgi:drug/metabolite transporter (DMT)-like permease